MWLIVLAACDEGASLRWAPGGDGIVSDPTTGGSTGEVDTSSNGTSSSETSSSETSSSETSSTTGTSTGGTSTTASCPPGLVCVDSFPFVADDTTTGAPSQVDAYGCAPDTDESGPEVVYQVTLAEDGYLVASLSDLGAGVDVDVHVLDALDPDACLDRGHWDAGALLPAGTYYVAVDSWVDANGDAQSGEYTLTLGLNRYDDHLADGLDDEVWSAALYGFDAAWQQGDTDRLEYGVIDFSLPSTEPRMFWVDLRTGEMLFAELTSHGIGSQDPSDLAMADTFSNVSGSNASSLGMLRTAETYYGSHGYSMRLDGLEAGYNDNVRDRVIVVHSADYATQDFVDDYGYLGRSQGCPAIDPAVSDDLIDTVADGALMLAWYPDSDYLADSDYLDGL
ncbi:MAG: murein L,D-transpeptidase catalytic domain family protein [Myxococcota bacterium]